MLGFASLNPTYELNMTIGKLAGFNDIYDPKAFILVNHSSFPQKLDIFGSLCEQLTTEYPNFKPYQKVISKIKTAQKLRNKFMHNGMNHNPETNRIEMPQASARGKLKINIEPIDVTDIKKAIIEIDEAQISLYKLIFGREIKPVWERKQQ